MTQKDGVVEWLSPRRKIIFSLSLIMVLYGFLEGGCFAALEILDRWKGIIYEPQYLSYSLNQSKTSDRFFDDPSFHLAHDPLLGWSPKKNWVAENALDQINSQGLRGSKEYTKDSTDDTYRISTLGDSFTFGSEVQLSSTFQVALENMEPTWEVLNFGLPGAGLDQVYLHYKDKGKGYTSDVVMIGFFNGGMRRSVNVYRPHMNKKAGAITKPRFILEDGELLLIPNPFPSREHYRELRKNPCRELQRIAQYDRFVSENRCSSMWEKLPSVRLWFVVKKQLRQKTQNTNSRKKEYLHAEFYEKDHEAYLVTTKIFEELIKDIKSTGAYPLIAIFPAHINFEQEELREGKPHATLLEFLDEKEYDYIDFTDEFPQHVEDGTIDQFFARKKWGHYSERGNEVVAKVIRDYVHTTIPLQE
jgi:hypothetical protein